MGRGWERALLAAWIVAAAVPVALAVMFAASGAPLGTVVRVLLLLVGIPLIAFVVWWRVRARRLGHEALPAHRPMPKPVAAPDEEAAIDMDALAAVDGPFTACPECGYLGIRAPGIRDGLWPGGGEVGGRFVCPRCHWQGIPVEFESGDEYAAFVRELHDASRTNAT